MSSPITYATPENVTDFDRYNLSPIQLVNHLEVYGARDPTFLGLKCPGTHYRTTLNFIINFFLKQGICSNTRERNDDAFVLQFDSDIDCYQCQWNNQSQQVEVTRITGDPITILVK